MTHEQRLEDLLANPASSQGLSPQEAEIFQAMCGELGGLVSQIAGSIAAEKVNQVSSGATVDLLTLFQSVSTALSDNAGEESLWDQFQGQIAEAKVTLAEICQGPVSVNELDAAKCQVEALLQLMEQVGESGVADTRQNRYSFWSRLPSRARAILFYKLF
ncbi:hypothetical protein [Almyronema epifaneia]|uniref:Uncharacterized protein n=1 Tax=Almyronema epifaneia S1 TaxID=2991925 RepID=A0ABW6IA66_9CYAN